MADLPAGAVPSNISELEFFSGVAFENVSLEIGNKVLVHAAIAPQRPARDFYVALIIKCLHSKQYRYNALIFCDEDEEVVQVGMASVLKVEPEETAPAHVMVKIRSSASRSLFWPHATSELLWPPRLPGLHHDVSLELLGPPLLGTLKGHLRMTG